MRSNTYATTHLDARNFFEAQPANLGGARNSQFKKNNFGASVGGPIKKDKTFFYLVYEGLRLAQTDAIQTTTLPAACHFLSINGVPTIVGGGTITPQVAAEIASATNSAMWTGVTPTILDHRPVGNVTVLGLPTAAAPTNTQCGGITAGSNAGNLTNPTSPLNTNLNNMTVPWIGQFPFANETTSGGPSSAAQSNFTFPGESAGREDYGQIRIDQNISNSDTFFGRYTFDDNRLSIPYASLSTNDTGSGYPQFFSIGNSRNQYVTFGENHIFSADRIEPRAAFL